MLLKNNLNLYWFLFKYKYKNGKETCTGKQQANFALQIIQWIWSHNSDLIFNILFLKLTVQIGSETHSFETSEKNFQTYKRNFLSRITLFIENVKETESSKPMLALLDQCWSSRWHQVILSETPFIGYWILWRGIPFEEIVSLVLR